MLWMNSQSFATAVIGEKTGFKALHKTAKTHEDKKSQIYTER